MKKKLICMIVTCVICFCAGVGTLVGCLVSQDKGVAVETSAETATQPNDTSKYWGDEGTNVDIDWEGSGTEEDPYLISSAEELAGLSYRIYYDTVANENDKIVAGNETFYYYTKYFKQTADLDLSAYWWQPIGCRYNRNDEYVNQYFGGNYDGNGHVVSGIYTSRGSSRKFNHHGLFGYINRKYGDISLRLYIKNLGIIDSYIKGYDYVGAITGYADSVFVENCYSEATIIGSNYVGGIAGNIRDGRLIDCHNSGEITGVSLVGGISGYIDFQNTHGIPITNCYNTGEIYATGSQVGGIGGSIPYISMQDCYNIADVSGKTAVGGIAGFASGKEFIKFCYNAGKIIGTDYVGGLLGNVKGPNMLILGNYNISSINGVNLVGGLIGNASNVNLVNNYTKGIINGTGDMIGGIIGQISNIATVMYAYNSAQVTGANQVGGIVGLQNSATYTINSFNLGQIDGTSKVGGCIGETNSASFIKNCYYGGSCTIDFGVGEGDGDCVKLDNLENLVKSENFFTDKTNWHIKPWDFDMVWKIENNLPVISMENLKPKNELTWGDEGTNVDIEWEGSGTKEDPYLISSAEELAGLAWRVNNGIVKYNSEKKSDQYYLNCYFKQTNNINVSDYLWNPIGNVNNKFSGNYDGDNFTISGVYTNQQDNYQAIFGYVYGNNSSISNITISNSLILGVSYVGGIGGCIVNSTIVNCTNNGNLIMACNKFAGGISGYGNVNNCLNSGIVIGINAGAIIGDSSSVSLIACINKGIVIGDTINGIGFGNTNNCSNFGDVIGVNASGIGGTNVTNCTSHGTIIGTTSVGGITSSLGTGTIKNCAVFGRIIFTGTDLTKAGGIAGTASATGKIDGCSFIGTSNVELNPICGSTAVISNCYAIVNGNKSYTEGDFAGFTICKNVNEDRPIQRSLYHVATFAPEVDIIAYFKSNGYTGPAEVEETA